MEEKARKRLRFFWRMANRLPMVIVRIAVIYKTSCQIAVMVRNTVKRTIIRMNAAAPFEMTDRKAVTLIGAPS